MNSDTRKMIEEYERKIAVMKAFDEGAEIQFLGILTNKTRWLDLSDPVWNWEDGIDYRIKPKPREVRVAFRSDGYPFRVFDYTKTPVRLEDEILKTYLFREVLDD